MKSIVKYLTLLCVSLMLSVSLQANNDTIKIGAIVASTGPASFIGSPELKTLKLYVKKINDEGGVLGKKLELVYYDTGANPKKAVTFAKRL
ncbi:MAG: ABC transporter substrate-binding protein, partial [Epsilonproteobacteria bacterium]|nr:ABC transporter substrate-binding protein [Campylobacterota bacterium]